MTARLGEPLLEVCVGSVADIRAARAGGADRVELCAALELGGLTPTLGLVETALSTAADMPLIAMLRPRAGGFCYDRDEFAAMLRDAELLLDRGVAGLAFGVLTRDGRIDAPRCRELVALVGAAQTVFHRAFDFAPDQDAALEELLAVGVTRVLTSGGQATAMAGSDQIRRLVDRAADCLEILPGGGIRADHAAALLAATGCRQLHIGAAVGVDDGSITARAGMSLWDNRFSSGPAHRSVESAQVAAVARAIREPAAR